jgi:serine/threonine-protein kinase RsbW
MMQTIQQLRFTSVPENIAVVERLIDEVRETNGFDEVRYGDVLIAMTEAVNNAIVHGNRLNPDFEVFVDMEIREGGTLFFRVTDQGPGFDFTNVPDPTSPENLEKPNGRGVFLMRQLSDSCEFLDHGRIVELNFEGVIHTS